MDGLESFRCVCRICRSYNLNLNWNEDFDELIRMSYKDCFYKYTQFKESMGDPLSQFLCEDCATGVKNFHLIVEKSMETLKLWEEQLATVKRSSSGIADDTCSTSVSIGKPNQKHKKKRSKRSGNVYSEVFAVQQEETYSPIEYSIKSSGKHDIPLQESNIMGDVNKVQNGTEARNEVYHCRDLEELDPSTEPFLEVFKINDNLDQSFDQNQGSVNLGTSSGIIDLNSSAEEFTPTNLDNDVTNQESKNCENVHSIESFEFVETDIILCKETDDQNMVEEDFNVAQKKLGARHSEERNYGSNANLILLHYDDKPASRIAKTPAMCSYCSKMIRSRYYLKLHEQTHQENRSREVSCPTCGVNLFNKQALYAHKKTHDKNRVKRFKCEFCDKAFFNRGACNVHRRIHLGQMTQCPLCPKEFYRQVELDKHMPSHSHESLNSGKGAKQKKYYVHCKDCDKKVLSDRFNSHRAVHRKDRYMRCTICEKDFFSRQSGSKHMLCVHKRKAGNYDDITIYYNNKSRPRLSSLIMKQQEDVEPVA